MSLHRNFEAQQRAQVKKNIQGYSLSQKGEDGQRRFTRGDR